MIDAPGARDRRVADASDSHDARRARAAPEPLRAFNDAGVLAAADVHVALRLAALAGGGAGAAGALAGGEAGAGSALAGGGASGADALAGGEAGAVALATALAVRGPRLGHVYVDLATIAVRATVDADEPVDVSALPWPDPEAWVSALRRSSLVAVGESGGETLPLRLVGTRLYLDRYWCEETRVASDLLALGSAGAPVVDAGLLADGLRRLFPGDADGRQRLAAQTATLRRLTVVAGGPGTGKTTTVARILALLAEQAAGAGRPPPLVALAAPTGKAAVRLEEAVRAESLTLDVDATIREQLLALSGSTLHRLLGWRPGSHSRFRHDRANRLAHDVVVVDETSMVSLSLMARLVEAIRPGARLILVGDPGQLTSIEAGAVLGDIVGPADSETAAPGDAAVERRPAMDGGAAAAGEAAAGGEPAGDEHAALGEAEAGAEGSADGEAIVRGAAGIAGAIVVLDRSHRFGPGIGALAEAVRRGDPGATLRALHARPDEITWIAADPADEPDALSAVRDGAVAAGRAACIAAAAGDVASALAAIGAFRVLCAHRHGDYGAGTWRARVEAWLASAIDGFAAQGAWYPGRPLLVTENDHALRLYNGDTGIVVAGPGGHPAVAFERHDSLLPPARLDAVETVYAMTIHKAQGSQFHTAAVVLPPASSPILTRELLYTAVTRARMHLILAGSEQAIAAAVLRPVARASGLRARLWGEPAGP